MQTIDGVDLAMTDFGTKGYCTHEPGSGTQEESITFTGLTQNSNNTTTLTGISNVGFLAPYTETSGYAKSHAGATQMVVTNSAAFYDNFANKNDDETITQTWTFTNPNVPRIDVEPSYLAGSELFFATKQYVDSVAIAGAPNASTTVKGIVQLPSQTQTDARTTTGSTGALLAVTPDVLRATKYIDGLISAVGTDAYAATPTPQVSSLVDSLAVFIEADVGNTGAATFALGATAAKAIKKYGNKDLLTGDFVAGGKYWLVYDLSSDVWMLSTETSQQKISQIGSEIYGASGAGTDAYAVTYVPAIPALTSGLHLSFRADVINTGAATFSPNGLTAKAIVRADGSPLQDNDIRANSDVDLIYNSVADVWMMQLQVANVTDKVSITTTPVTVASTNAETTLLTVSIPANTLGTNNGVIARLNISNFVGNNGAKTATIRAKYGATTLTTSQLVGVDATALEGYFEFQLLASGATNSQVGFFLGDVVETSSGVTGGDQAHDVATGTSAIDSTAAANLVITAQWDSSSANNTLTMHSAYVKRLS